MAKMADLEAQTREIPDTAEPDTTDASNGCQVIDGYCQTCGERK